jgi:hypothetical protein
MPLWLVWLRGTGFQPVIRTVIHEPFDGCRDARIICREIRSDARWTGTHKDYDRIDVTEVEHGE